MTTHTWLPEAPRPTVRPYRRPPKPRRGNRASSLERLRERLSDKIDASGGPDACWPWTGALLPNGQPTISWHNKQRTAARMVYLVTHEVDLPRGVRVLRTCDNKLCLNPEHLRA